MIEFVRGDFFDYEADIRVNTVNCVGVMGAGVALAFKKKYPDMFKEYVRQCKAGEMLPGKPVVWSNNDLLKDEVEIINFPTKNDWRKPSKYEYIEDGLVWLSSYLENKTQKTITLPALGCGHGGLEWKRVKQLIIKYLDNSTSHIFVFEPSSSKKAGRAIPDNTKLEDELLSFGIELISSASDLYPEGLLQYTNNDLYCYGSDFLKNGFDIAIISSTKPSSDEEGVIDGLLNYSRKNDLSILFGGTAFDKKMAIKCANIGLSVGVFLPTGIVKTVSKLKEFNEESGFAVLSIGDPYVAFDKKAYMPSVLSRAFIGRNVVFTTDRLSWIRRQYRLLQQGSSNFAYVNYDWLSSDEVNAVTMISAQPIDISKPNWSEIIT